MRTRSDSGIGSMTSSATAPGMRPPSREPTRDGIDARYQRNFNWKRYVSHSLSVLLIWAKLGEARVMPGSANCGVLRKLIDSLRSSIDHSEPIGTRRESDALTLAILPLRNVLPPRLPACSPGATMKRKALVGNSASDVSGDPAVGPSTEASTTTGRSPLRPSTLPKPGPSEPDGMVKGVPDLSSVTLETVQPLNSFPAQPPNWVRATA